MKKAVLLLIAFLTTNCYGQVNYGSCQAVPSGSPCFFGLYNFYITNVSFGTLSFSGGDCSGDGSDDGYQDKYNTASGTVVAAQTYTFSVRRASSFFSPQYGFFSAWVDWNNDGDFSDANELLFTVGGASNGPVSQSFSVTVPVTAVNGDHRLRVRADLTSQGGNPNPCSAGSYGDTKDFKLTVTGGGGCDVTIHTPYDNGANPCLYGCAATLSADPAGVAPFGYTWSPALGTDSVIYGACAGSYTVTMTDGNGCTATKSVTINQHDSIHITAVVTPIVYHCDSMIGGSIDISSVTGGAGSIYTYLWDTGPTTQKIDSLDEDTYCVTIKDATSCSLDTCFALIAPTPPPHLSIQLAGVNPSCNGCTDGSITGHPSGGTLPYTYIWTPSGPTDSIATGLGSGLYQVCVMDSNSCETCDTITLLVPCSVTIHTPFDNGANPCLYGCAATLTTEVAGAGPFSFEWAGLITTDSLIGNACAGTYSVTLTDNNGCTATDSATINQPDSMNITAVVQNIDYHCDTLVPGFIHIISIAGGGGAPYIYHWDSGSDSLNLDSIKVTGRYCLTIIDSHSCGFDTCFDVSITTLPLSLQLDSVNVSCGSCSDGSVTAHAAGGKPPYSYSWTPSITTDSMATGLPGGQYKICVTDSNGCVVCDSIILGSPLLTAELQDELFSISPNPAGNELLIRTHQDEISKIEIFNVLGETIKTEKNPGKQMIVDLSTLSPGLYFVQVTTGSQRWLRRFVKE